MNKKLLAKLAFTTIALTMANTGHAGLITFDNVDYATTVVGAAQTTYNAAVDELLSQFEDQVNANAGTGDLKLSEYFGALGNSTSIAASGLGASYQNDFEFFTIGGGAGFGGQLAPGKTLTDLQDGIQGTLSGVGASASVTLGAKAGLIFKSPWFWGLVDPTRLKGYVGLFFFPINLAGFGSGNVTSVSAIGQYQLMKPMSMGLGMLKWNGVSLSSGIRFSKFSLDASYSKTVTQSESMDVGGTPVTTSLTTPLEIELSIASTTTTIPFEASTSVRLLYFLSLMAGTAFDFNVGSSSGGVTAPDTTVTVDHGGSAAFTGDNTTTADATVDTAFANGEGNPTFLNWRGFIGAQIEFGVGGIFVNFEKSILKSQYGVNVGLNLFY